MDKQKAERFAQYLVSKYGEDGAKKKIQKILKTGKVDLEDLKGFAESEQKSKGKTPKDLHGAKLNYIKTLKHQCADDEELVYYKKGGSVDCGCKKKENGGEIKKALSGTVANFKEDLKKKQQQNQQLQKPKWTDAKDNELKKLSEKKTLTPQEKQRLQQLRSEFKNSSNAKDYEVEEGKKGMKVEKDCGGSSIVKKFKSARCGSKMKKHKLGGSLNGIPFYQEGTIRGGIHGLIDNTKNFIKGITGDLTPLRYLNNPNTYTQGGFYKYLYNPLLKKWTILRGMHGALDNKYTKGRNTSIKTISGNNLFFTPVNSTFDSYNDGTTEFRNDGTVYYKGKKI